jgi:stage V sporulation protein G
MGTELSVKRMTRVSTDGAIKAFCDIMIGNCLLVKSFKVVDGKKGLFVSMPREQGRNGQWYDSVIPLSKEARDKLSNIVLEAYNAPPESYE